MTNQQAFDGVWKRLVTEVGKGKCVDTSNGWCRYINEDENKCAIGALMPDDLCELAETYSNKVGNASIVDLIKKRKKIREFLYGVDVNLLSVMQEIHDYCYGPQARNRLEEIAKRWNLTVPT